jgi:phage-related protein
MEFDFWVDSQGVSPVEEFVQTLSEKEKKAIIKKIDHLLQTNLLTLIKTEVVKFFKGVKKKYGFSLFELIIFRYRFFFVVLVGGEQATFIHSFPKKTNKTPKKEIIKATRIAVILKDKII